MSDVKRDVITKPGEVRSHSDNLGDYRMGAPLTQADKDAQKVLSVAKDDLSPLRRDPSFMTRDYPPLPRMKTSIEHEMAMLNRDPKRLDAALTAMEKHPIDGLNIKEEKDAKGNRSVTFEIPGTEHYQSQQMRYDILSLKDEKNAQLLAANMKERPDPLSYKELQTLANTMKSYNGNEGALDRMLSNVSEELRLRAPRTGGGVGLGSNGDKGGALLVPGYPGNGWTYFKTTGEITTRNDYQ